MGRFYPFRFLSRIKKRFLVKSDPPKQQPATADCGQFPMDQTCFRNYSALLGKGTFFEERDHLSNQRFLLFFRHKIRQKQHPSERLDFGARNWGVAICLNLSTMEASLDKHCAIRRCGLLFFQGVLGALVSFIPLNRYIE